MQAGLGVCLWRARVVGSNRRCAVTDRGGWWRLLRWAGMSTVLAAALWAPPVAASQEPDAAGVNSRALVDGGRFERPQPTATTSVSSGVWVWGRGRRVYYLTEGRV